MFLQHPSSHRSSHKLQSFSDFGATGSPLGEPLWNGRASAEKQTAGNHSYDAGCGCLTCLSDSSGSDKPSPTEQNTATYSVADEPTRPITAGDTSTGVIGTSGDVDQFTITLTAGQTYMISMRGTGDSALADAYLTLANSGGTVVAFDDDGGSGRNSLLTFTATTTGTYTISAQGYPGDGLTGGYTIDVRQMTSDAVGSTLGAAKSINVGQTTFGFIESSSDVDMYKVTLTADTFYSIELAGGADYNTDPASVRRGEVDTIITIYDAAGNVVATNDDLSYPEDVSSGLSFSPSASGTYYIEVKAYPRQTGGYTLDVAEIDLDALDPLDTIDWGTQLPSNHVTVYFAAAGEVFDGVSSLGWSAYEKEQAMEALQTWAEVSNLTFSVATSAATATFKLVTTTSSDFLGYFNPPGTTNAGVGVFATNGDGWNTTGGLEQGGYGWITLVHEFGHGLGLAHPHDNGGTSTVMPGVTGPFDSYGVFDLNQGVYTTMSYNDGWPLHPSGLGSSASYGWQGGPGAFDIALIQIKYGASSANTGNNVYVLPTANAAGTFWDVIWDTGGTDSIVHNGTVAARIDLTAATLDYSPTGGGVISYVTGIFGGFTIAAGVVIENASGGTGADVLIGNSAANILDGGAGNDTLEGRGGNDTFRFEIGDGQDIVTDLAAGDIVKIYGFTSAQSVVQNGANVIVTLSGTQVITFQNTTVAAVQAALQFPDAPPSGPTEGDDVLTGTEGVDTINGLGGNDTIDALGDHDFIDGGAGADTMTGGSGDDRYDVDNAGDVVVELSGGGNDTVETRVSYTLSPNVEYLVLAGTAGINGTGNSSDNGIYGNAGANHLQGLGGNDLLKGDNTWAPDGHDILDGGAGADTMFGGMGNDTFYVDNAGDVVTEYAGEGDDQVLSSITYTLTAEVEKLTLTGLAAINGTGNALNNLITGNSGANVLNGRGGADTMIGGSGNDDYIVDHAQDLAVELSGEGVDRVKASVSYVLGPDMERLSLTGTMPINGTGNNLANVLTGNSAANTLSGLGGDDKLDGRGGADIMSGGLGNDLYVVTDVGDVVTEAAGEGIDRVNSSISYTLGDNVEDLALAGNAAIGATGNGLTNVLTGNSGSNTLLGLDGNDRLYGSGGNDVLDGGAGADVMFGGLSNDIFYVDDRNDYVREEAGQGIDTVYASVGDVLRPNVENLVLTGTASVNGRGNELANSISGNSAGNELFGLAGSDFLYGNEGNDTLEGGAGADTMSGGLGADNFVFRDGDFGGLTAITADKVTDFSQVETDRLRLDLVDANTSLAGDQAFSFIGTGGFSSTAGELRYEQIDGNTIVYGDTNGDGVADFMILLTGSHSLTSNDFVI